MSALLAAEFVRLGHSVRVATQTPSTEAPDFGYPILRQPSVRELTKAIAWSDVYWQNNLSLRTLWPALLLSKPVVITHQGSYCQAPSGLALGQRLKHAVVNHTTGVAISKAVAACFAVDSIVIPNPYDARGFGVDNTVTERAGDLVFLGRIVSEKGVDLLLSALAALRGRGLTPHLTIVGAGPELAAMQELAARLGLVEQVDFVGPKRGEELALLLRGHKIMVVPSRYDEPFGVVALEGIACGCVIVGSEGGGLPEAIGPCGLTFPNGDVNALAEVIASLLGRPNERRALQAGATRHLAKFHPDTIAEAYLNVFHSKLA